MHRRRRVRSGPNSTHAHHALETEEDYTDDAEISEPMTHTESSGDGDDDETCLCCERQCICEDAKRFIHRGIQPSRAVRVPDSALPPGVVRHTCEWLSAPDTGCGLSHFAFLMVNTLASEKTHTYIGTSRNPPAKVSAFNRGDIRSRKNTKQGRPHWRIEQMVGPFDTRDDARRFRVAWDDHTRGIQPRIKKGQMLARQWKLECWSMRMAEKR